MMPAWEEMQKLQDEGKCRSIGVSNFTTRRFEEFFFQNTDVIPSVNQVELHPFWTRVELVQYCRQISPTLHAIACWHGLSTGLQFNPIP